MHCPECGFVNAEGANYFQRCGAFLGAQTAEGGADSQTATYRIDETGGYVPVEPDALQTAIRLEHSTLPPYLYALYSIEPGKNREIAALIASVAIEEMTHYQVTSNADA